MPRRKKIDRPQKLEVYIPESIKMKMELELFSDVICGVPHGARSELVAGLIKDWLENRGVMV